MGKLKYKLGDIVKTTQYGNLEIIGLDVATRGPEYLLSVDESHEHAPKIDEDWEVYCGSNKKDGIVGTPGIWLYENEIEGLCSIDEIEATVVEHFKEEYAGTGKHLRRFKSGAVRSDDRGREKPSFISPYALKFLAEHFSANAAFFNGNDSAKNYFKGIEPVDIEDSLERHVLDFKFAMMPHRRDRDAIKKSLVEIMANCVMGLHQIGMEEDGDYKTVYEKTEYIKKED